MKHNIKTSKESTEMKQGLSTITTPRLLVRATKWAPSVKPIRKTSKTAHFGAHKKLK